ncbi:MAG: hypothetical protein WC872_01930 [Candidatus Absconditabacterales bacterium]
MLAKKYRLKGKDVIFLSKKRQYFYSDLFGFFYSNQYPNLNFNQISFHVSIKLSKKSSHRNIIKRAVMNYIRENNISKTLINQKFRKFFINLNKNKIPQFQKSIEKFDKKAINQYTISAFKKSFSNFKNNIGVS